MATIEFNWNPTDRQLRQFGFAALPALPFVAFLFSGRPPVAEWTSANTIVIGAAAAVGLLLAILSFLTPQAIRLVFIGACMLAFPIGLVIGEVILLIIFLGLFTPIAIYFRLIGRDELKRSVDRNCKSYWQARDSNSDIKSYFRQS
ncbi:MAG: hypothetical protein P8N76_26705 [Pirellulaceae bacterium]|nr:hypothetical protein [Pirellulaceae bacterium]